MQLCMQLSSVGEFPSGVALGEVCLCHDEGVMFVVLVVGGACIGWHSFPLAFCLCCNGHKWPWLLLQWLVGPFPARLCCPVVMLCAAARLFSAAAGHRIQGPEAAVSGAAVGSLGCQTLVD